jgi:putative transposase
MDFVHDQLATGSKLGNLTVVDMLSRAHRRLCFGLGFGAPGVIELLERACCEVGYSRFSRSKAFSFEATSV